MTVKELINLASKMQNDIDEAAKNKGFYFATVRVNKVDIVDIKTVKHDNAFLILSTDNPNFQSHIYKDDIDTITVTYFDTDKKTRRVEYYSEV